jgi:hypothetical protein
VPNSQTNVDVMTAVEWLVANLDIDLVDSDWYIQKAKEREKQQIIDSRQSGIDATINGKSISNIDYYNEKFNHESNN